MKLTVLMVALFLVLLPCISLAFYYSLIVFCFSDLINTTLKDLFYDFGSLIFLLSSFFFCVCMSWQWRNRSLFPVALAFGSFLCTHLHM